MAELRTKRWYFLTVGTAMGKPIFDALASDQEFLAIPRSGAELRNKQLVRMYFPCDSHAPAEGMFHGAECANLDPNQPPKPIDGLEQAFRSMLGVQAPTARETPVIMVLADAKFDGLMRGYQLALNKQYMQLGALPIVNLIYCEDDVSAENLMRLMELRDSAARYEQAYQWNKHPVSAPAPASPVPPSGSSAGISDETRRLLQLDESVTAIVEVYRQRITSNYVFFRPSIPPKKLATAIQTYAPDAVNVPALVLIDATVFGSAKEGALITTRHIYSRYTMTPARRMDLYDIHTVEYIQKWPSNPLMINGTEFVQNPTVEPPAMVLVAQMLGAIRLALHKQAEPFQAMAAEVKSAATMIKELKELLDIGAITQQEFDEKRQKYLEKL